MKNQKHEFLVFFFHFNLANLGYEIFSNDKEIVTLATKN